MRASPEPEDGQVAWRASASGRVDMASVAACPGARVSRATCRPESSRILSSRAWSSAKPITTQPDMPAARTGTITSW